MRTREEIFEVVNGEGKGIDGVKLGMLLEVLLDIRDMLDEKE